MNGFSVGPGYVEAEKKTGLLLIGNMQFGFGLGV